VARAKTTATADAAAAQSAGPQAAAADDPAAGATEAVAGDADRAAPEAEAAAVIDADPVPADAGESDGGESDGGGPDGLADPAPDPVADPGPVVVAPPRRRAGGFLPTVLGGAVAAGLGFGAAIYVLPPFLSPPQTAGELTELSDQIAARSARIDEIGAAVAALQTGKAGADDLAGLTATTADLAAGLAAAREAVDSLQTGLSDAAARLASFEARLATLEKRPVEGGAASATALEAFGRDMAAMRAEIAAERIALDAAEQRIAAAAADAAARLASVDAEARKLRAEAEAEARRGAALASLRHVQAALESGAPIGDALAGLSAAGIAVPQALSDQAQGIPSLAALRDAFPGAARAALSAALRVRSADADTWTRLGAFLRSQSGARSLAPRAGDDPDAILSRAEAALRLGDLSGAIAAIADLPPEAQAPMAEWLALADRRLSAAAAIADLVGAVTGQEASE